MTGRSQPTDPRMCFRFAVQLRPSTMFLLLCVMFQILVKISKFCLFVMVAEMHGAHRLQPCCMWHAAISSCRHFSARFAAAFLYYTCWGCDKLLLDALCSSKCMCVVSHPQRHMPRTFFCMPSIALAGMPAAGCSRFQQQLFLSVLSHVTVLVSSNGKKSL
jgi:hypothetical protein